jgi:septal ring factor EnvC (AmiA/AmiB activator)
MAHERGVTAMSAAVIDREDVASGPDAPAPTPVRWSRRHHRLLIAIVFVLVVLNALVVWNLVATNATANQLQQTQVATAEQLAQTRLDLATTHAKLDAAVANLKRQTATRDQLRRTDASTRSAARQAAAEVKQTLDRIAAQRFQTGSLTNCVTRLQSAMNALSTGDALSAAGALEGVDASCPASAP